MKKHFFPAVVLALALVAGCASSSAMKKHVRAYAQSTAERAAPDGELAERLDRLCTSTATCQLSSTQQKHCASLKASIAADYQAAQRLLREVEP